MLSYHFKNLKDVQDEIILYVHYESKMNYKLKAEMSWSELKRLHSKFCIETENELIEKYELQTS